MAHSSQLRDLLLGSAPGQLHLSAVRSRADELKRSLDQIIQSLQFAADRVQWPDVLDRFAVVNVQYQQLLDALRPLLRQFAAYPRSVNQTNAPVLPVMLATKLLPEQEAEEGALLGGLEAEQRRLGVAGGAAPVQLSVAERFAWVQGQERELNHLIDQLSREEGAPLGDRRRKEVAAAAAAAAAPPAAKPAAPTPQRPRQQVADPLLAAAAFGAGLA